MDRPPLDDGMVIYATRYCLGRSSYAVGECVEYLLAHWDALQPKTRAVIVRDVKEAIVDNRCGFMVDCTQWRRVVERSRRENETR